MDIYANATSHKKGSIVQEAARIVPVIMCGGAGSRLWPVSREAMPKQYVPLLGAQSTFQTTARLLADHQIFGRPIVIASAEHSVTVEEQLTSVGVDARIVLEPARRDTAATVAVAVELALGTDPGAVVGVFAADHIIRDAPQFADICARAAAAAASGLIVAIGTPPSAPSSAYGYIRQGRELAPDLRQIEDFVEKPDATRAARFLQDGYLWNSGNFIFSAQTMRAELERLAPDVLSPVCAAIARAVTKRGHTLLDAASLQSAPATSIDHAVMERTDRAAVICGDFGWTDIGGWPAVWELSEKDDSGNAAGERCYVLDSRDNLVRSDGMLIALVGVEGLAVIATPDAVLVARRDRADQIREMVGTLQRNGEAEARLHRRVRRPWGEYVSIDAGERHQVKRITVRPGGVLSLQRHFHRTEHWVVVRGAAEVTRDDETLLVHENGAITLQPGCVHRLANPGKIPLELIEVQIGSYFGEDDIVRLDDVYGRA